MNKALQGRSSKANLEVKLGITLILVLLAIFVFVAYRRFDQQIEASAQYAANRQPGGSATASDTGGEANSTSETVVRPKGQADDVRSPTIAGDQRPLAPSQPTVASEHPLPNYVPNPLSLAHGESWSPIEKVELEEPLAGRSDETSVEMAVGKVSRPIQPASLQRPADERLKAADPDLEAATAVASSDLSSATSETVRANDSFWLISQRAYGSGVYFRALYEYNRDRFPLPDRLPQGSEVRVPPLDELQRRFPAHWPASSQTVPATVSATPSAASPAKAARLPSRREPTSTRPYVTRDGDSVFDIARFQLGQASRYVEIIRLNAPSLRDRLEDLPAGMELQIPVR